MADETTITITLPDDVTYEYDNSIVTFNGPEGTIEKDVTDKRISVSGDDELILTYPAANKTAKRVIYSNASRLRNAAHGVVDPWTYTMKICSGHFPMQVQVQDDELVIENFIGESTPRSIESTPRSITIPDDVDIDVDGDDLLLTSFDKERAGQVAGRIENMCKRTGFDERIFQDGIYITEKPQKLSQKR
jgi:large subunit ribosomal protein L6